MLFLPEILTWFFVQMLSSAEGFLLIQEPPSQFFHRLLRLHQLFSLSPSSSMMTVLFCLVLVLVLFLYGLGVITSPGLSS